MKRWITRLALLLAILSPALSAAEPPITIGVTLGLSGKYANMAAMQKKGFELWAQQLNAEGGLLGRPVEVRIEDDLSTPAEAERRYRRMIEEERVDLLFGPYSSGITKAVLPLIEEHRYPMLASGAASDTLWQRGGKYLFGIFIPSSRYAVGFLEMAALNGITSVAVVAADDPFSRSVAEGAVAWAKRFGLEVKLDERFAKGTRELTTLARRIAAAGTEAVVVGGHFNESVDVRRALKEIGFEPRAYYASIGPAMEAYRDTLGDAADGVFSASQWEPEAIHRPGDRERFLEPFIARYGVTPSYHAANAYAAGQILALAVTKAGALDRERIREILASMDAMSIIGRYGVDAGGMQIKHIPIDLQWQDGDKVIVWPRGLAKAAPRIGQAPKTATEAR